MDIHGRVIGMMSDITFPSMEITLNPGDRAYFYTDGLPEMADASHEYLGYDRFLDIVSSTSDRPLSDALDSIISLAMSFRGSEQIVDDLVIIGVEVLRKD